MKLKNIFTLVIFVFLCHTFFYSCNKGPELSNNPEKPSMDSRITRDLLDFKSLMLTKVTGEMSIDSATWHIEGLLNFDNANNTHSFVNSFLLEDSVSVASTNDMLTMDQVISIYTNFQSFISTSLQTNPNLRVDLVDVDIHSNGLKDGTLVVKIGVIIGVPDSQLKSSQTYPPFGETDDWYWYNHYGRCSGGGTPNDAVIMLQNRFVSVGNIRGYYTDVESNTAFPHDYDDPNNPYGDHMIFEGGALEAPPNCTCIGHDEMNYYLSKFDYIKENQDPNNGKTYSTVVVGQDQYMGPGNGFHKYTFYFGFFHEGVNPE